MESSTDNTDLSFTSTLAPRGMIFLLKLISYLPLPVLFLFGSLIGELAYWLVKSRRTITITNLHACFPEKTSSEVRNIARSHFRQLVIGALILSVAWWASPKRLKRLVDFKNKEYLDKLIDENQNIVILAPHFTNLEFLGFTLFAEMPMTTMYQKHKNPIVDKFMADRRRRFGTRLFGNKESLTPLVKSVRSGVPFYYLPDQDPGKKRGIFAPFYGIQTATFPTLSKITRLSQARVVPCMAKLKAFGTGFEVIFDPALDNYPSGDLVKDATVMNKAIEKLIEHSPEQYFWSHKRFKTRPDDESPFYS